MTITTTWTRLRSLGRDRRGLTTVEYMIVLCLIAAIGVATWQKLGSDVEGWLSGAKDKIQAQVAPEQ